MEEAKKNEIVGTVSWTFKFIFYTAKSRVLEERFIDQERRGPRQN